MSLAKNVGKNMGKNIRKIVSDKNSRKPFDHAKKSATDALKNFWKESATDALIGNKIANKVTKISKDSQQNNSQTVTNEHDKGITKEMYVSPEW